MNKPVILVVEDNEIQRKVIKLLAAEYGFDVILCAGCEDAVDAYAVGGDIYSMILMDLRLGDTDGVTCAGRIKNIKVPRGRRKVPMIAMTGYVAANDRERCTAMGFDDCLIKPFSSKEFQAMILKWSRVQGITPQEAEQNNVLEWRQRRDA
jgi:two-component system sensor histidine kinase/response regulator